MGAARGDFTSYQWFDNDDTDPDALTSLGSEGTDSTAGITRAVSTATVLRVVFQELDNGNFSGGVQMEAQKNGTGGYSNVTGSAGPGTIAVTAALYDDAGSLYTDTSLLTGSGTFEAGTAAGEWMDDTDGNIAGVSIGKLNYVEAVYCIYIVAAGNSDGDYWDIRFNSTASWASPQTALARITASVPAAGYTRRHQPFVNRWPTTRASRY